MAPALARLSPPARNWFLKEVAYLADRSPAAARHLIEAMRAARERIATHPRIGPPGLIPGTRRVVVGSYVLTVRVRGGAVEIAAIRHGRQADALAPKELAEAEE